MISSNPLTRVIFFQIKETADKLKNISEMAHFHFERKEPLLILVEDLKAQNFVDELLWKQPASSFLPHTSIDEPCSDWVVISKNKKNVNNAKVVFNLCPTPLAIEGPFRIIYEFEDLTTPYKKNLSSLRFDAYKQAGYLIEARN
jgi:DNA polymerase IIIc chi subunit